MNGVWFGYVGGRTALCKPKTESHEQWSHRGIKIKNAPSLCGGVYDLSYEDSLREQPGVYKFLYILFTVL